jgi:hypothetical protein
MSVIHKALGQLGQGQRESREKIQVSEERMKLERDLTTPTAKWFEMYKELEEKSSLRAKAYNERKNQKLHDRLWSYIGFSLLFIVFVFGGLTAFKQFAVPSYNSSPKIEVVHQFPEPYLQTDKNKKFNESRLEQYVSTSASVGVSAAGVVMPELVLTGIIEGSERLALINNRAVGEGEYIGNVLVKKIQGRRVILEFQGKEIFLVL